MCARRGGSKEIRNVGRSEVRRVNRGRLLLVCCIDIFNVAVLRAQTDVTLTI